MIGVGHNHASASLICRCNLCIELVLLKVESFRFFVRCLDASIQEANLFIECIDSGIISSTRKRLRGYVSPHFVLNALQACTMGL